MSAVVTIALIIVAFALVPAVTGTTRTRGFFEVAAWNLLGVAVARLLLRGWSSPLADQDSLFTLGTAEILGLAALSTFLIAGSCLLIFRISCAWAATPASHFPRAVALVANTILSATTASLAWVASAQVFYEYYRLIIPGLPVQWVIKPGDRLGDLWSTLQFLDGASASANAAAAFFWLAVGMTLSAHAIAWRNFTRRSQP